ncbi:MAG: recombinase family protein [Ruminococcus sp.]|nr:recombinase family protein [Ruminococcus sp.]
MLAFYTGYGVGDENVEQLVQTANRSGKRTRNGALWSNSAILRILRNPVYVQGDLRACTYLQAQGIVLEHPLEAYCEGNGWLFYGDRRALRRKMVAPVRRTPRVRTAPGHCGKRHLARCPGTSRVARRQH